MSTSYRRPGILKMGASLKKSENFSASSVALEMRSRISGRKAAISFTRPKRTSVCRVRSCASSIIIHE